MILTVNKTNFINDVVVPVSKIADNLQLTFDVVDGQSFLKTHVSSTDNSIIFLAKLPCNVDAPSAAIIPDCKTFLRLLAGVETEELKLEFATNSIKYKDPSFSFTYHLLDESYAINRKSISEEKINSLKFETRFVLTKTKLAEILKYNSIIPEAEKLYFYTDSDKTVQAEINDKQKANTNNIKIKIANQFSGNSISTEMPLNLQNLLLFSFSDNDITVEINHQLKVFKFEASNVKYVVSGLVK